MPTVRNICDQIQNAFTYLDDAKLTIFTNGISRSNARVAWYGPQDEDFLDNSQHPNIEQYITWLKSNNYLSLLFDGSLIQVTYDLWNNKVVGHRLNYFPCPYEIDPILFKRNKPPADVVDDCRNAGNVPILRSPVRFDFDLDTARPGHPASHMTMNSVDCRIACVAPLHVLRFLDFVFGHFYPEFHTAHGQFFATANSRHIGQACLVDQDRRSIHLSWDVHATATGGTLGR